MERNKNARRASPPPPAGQLANPNLKYTTRARARRSSAATRRYLYRRLAELSDARGGALELYGPPPGGDDAAEGGVVRTGLVAFNAKARASSSSP